MKEKVIKTKTTKLLKCKLTSNELDKYRDELAKKISDLWDKESERKVVSSSFVSDINRLKDISAELARKINEKVEYRDVTCEMYPDYEKGIMITDRMDLMEKVTERPLTDSERQMKLVKRKKDKD